MPLQKSIQALSRLVTGDQRYEDKLSGISTLSSYEASKIAEKNLRIKGKDLIGRSYCRKRSDESWERKSMRTKPYLRVIPKWTFFVKRSINKVLLPKWGALEVTLRIMRPGKLPWESWGQAAVFHSLLCLVPEKRDDSASSARTPWGAVLLPTHRKRGAN